MHQSMLTDSEDAPQASTSLTLNVGCSWLLDHFIHVHQGLFTRGHDGTRQWSPSPYGITSNGIVHSAAYNSRRRYLISIMAFSCSDATKNVTLLRNSRTYLLWAGSGYLDDHPYPIDPSVQIRAHSGVTSFQPALPHRRCLKMDLSIVLAVCNSWIGFYILCVCRASRDRLHLLRYYRHFPPKRSQL